MASVAKRTGEGGRAGEGWGELFTPGSHYSYFCVTRCLLGHWAKDKETKGMFYIQGPPISLHKGRQMPTKWTWKIEKGRGSLVEILINLLNSLSVSPLLRLPHGSAVKSLPANAGELVLIPESRRCPLGENGNLLQCSCLENPHGRRCLAGYTPWGGRVGHDLATDFGHY